MKHGVPYRGISGDLVPPLQPCLGFKTRSESIAPRASQALAARASKPTMGQSVPVWGLRCSTQAPALTVALQLGKHSQLL